MVNKPHITLTGTKSANATVITWNEPWVSADSPTVSVLASNFVAKRLTFQVSSSPSICQSCFHMNALSLFVSGFRTRLGTARRRSR